MLSLFKLLSVADWITPVIKSAESWYKDPLGAAGKCAVDYDKLLASGWDADSLKAFLADQDIFIFGDQYTYPQNEYTFYVPPEQFDNAVFLMSLYGIPVKFIAR